jgi:aminoglycoside phosphotransferase (APT) family kinase protein
VSPTDPQLASTLLEAAGRGSLARLTPMGVHSNAHFLVEDSAGDRYVLRHYKQTGPPHTALVRMQRECWVYDLLAEAGVPVPVVLARSEEPGLEATLTPLLGGEPLGTIVSSLAPAEAASAWSSCGQALAAAHAIDPLRAAAAGSEEVGIRGPTVSRGIWHRDEALELLDQLEVAPGDLGALQKLRVAVEEASPLYERAPVALCQYDPHLWQFLVAPDDEGAWRCTAILDWEHADFDDPDWDLAALDGFRWADIDLLPDEFFAGYGRAPSSPLHTLYRLERAAWILCAHADGHEWVDLSVPLAERLMRELLDSPDALGARIAGAVADG